MSKKANPFPVFVLLFLTVFLTGCDNWSWQRYNNKEYKFSILLPRFWHKELGSLDTVIMALAPLRGEQSRFQANANVVVTELAQALDLSTFFELNKEALISKLAVIENLGEGDIYAGLLAGKWLSFEGMARDLRVKIISAVWIKDKRVYTVTCTSEAKDFPRYETAFNRILRSLRVR